MSDQSLSATRQPHVVALGLLAMGTALPASADNATNDTDTYTWSAELIEVDQPDSTVTVQSRLVSDADVDFDALHEGDRVTKLAMLQPGSWVTATSRRHAKHFEEAVAELRPYNDVG